MKPNLIYIDAKDVLLQLANIIKELTKDEYVESIPIYSNASIGEHTRHIIEVFQQLLSGYKMGIINYDDRNRDLRLQNDIDFASESIATLITDLCKKDKELKINSLYCNINKSISSNYTRELLYNIDHCIHHQAIIKIGLIYFNKQKLVDSFGVAKSTLAYKKQCAH